jgi:gamma-glutamyl hercynylcysteine S-oxide hydrolase
MCRIAGYLGEVLPLSELLAAPSRSLRDQAKQPRELPPGVIGSDGWGVGWFAAEQPLPARYRSVLPIWVDENLDTLAGHVRSATIVASSRTAAARMPVAIANTPPFVAAAALLAHNGEIVGFPSAALDWIRSGLRAETRGEIIGHSDTEYLAAVLRDRSEATLVDRVRAMLEVVTRCVDAVRTSAQLNLIVATATELVVVRHAIGAAAPSLYVRRVATGFMAASEPMDEAADWQPLAQGEIVSAANVRGQQGIEWGRIEGS